MLPLASAFTLYLWVSIYDVEVRLTCVCEEMVLVSYVRSENPISSHDDDVFAKWRQKG